MKIMNEVSYLGAHDEEINTVTLDDPRARSSTRSPTSSKSAGGRSPIAKRPRLRAYLQKGGFVIVDDFKLPGWRGIPGGGWEPFAENMKRVLPEARFFDMEAIASDLPRVLRDQRRSTIFRRPTTAASRSFAASSKTTIRASGCM